MQVEPRQTTNVTIMQVSLLVLQFYFISVIPRKLHINCEISAFRCGDDDVFALLGCYIACVDSCLSTLTVEDGSDKLFRNVGKQLPT